MKRVIVKKSNVGALPKKLPSSTRAPQVVTTTEATTTCEHCGKEVTYSFRNLIGRMDVLRGFGIVPMTERMWRNSKGLPYIEIPGNGGRAIRYNVHALEAWARANGKEFSL